MIPIYSLLVFFYVLENGTFLVFPEKCFPRKKNKHLSKTKSFFSTFRI